MTDSRTRSIVFANGSRRPTSVKSLPDKSLYDRINSLRVNVEGVAFELHEQETSSGWTRCTTTVSLHGGGCVGQGEDVTYDANEQRAFAESAAPRIEGRYSSFSSFSRALDRAGTLFSGRPSQASSILYRRWAFESAALDLALRQADSSLGELWGMDPEPVRFVVSTGLGSPASTAALIDRLAVRSDLEFKIDYSEEFSDDLLRELSEFKIACIDFKGHYHGSFSGPPVDPDRYAAVAKALPHVILEDPGLSGLDVLAEEESRLSWDYPIRSVADLLQLPSTGWINIKPSRFGLVSELIRSIEYCVGRGIKMYGGGQFELGIGRVQAQEIAALFYPDGPNDLAPSEYNNSVVPPGVASSPLRIKQTKGFGAFP